MRMQDQNTPPVDDKTSAHSTESATKEHTLSLQGQFLLAMPALDDPYFARSVTLICQHDEEGCFGLTINNTIDINVAAVFDQLEIEVAKHIQNTPPLDAAVMRGGPVQTEQGFVIHENMGKTWANSIIVNDQLVVSASRDILHDIAAGDGPAQFLLVLGCASWAPGQLEEEILSNSWLNCPADQDILFNTPPKRRWQRAAESLGVDIHTISSLSGSA